MFPINWLRYLSLQAWGLVTIVNYFIGPHNWKWAKNAYVNWMFPTGWDFCQHRPIRGDNIGRPIPEFEECDVFIIRIFAQIFCVITSDTVLSHGAKVSMLGSKAFFILTIFGSVFLTFLHPCLKSHLSSTYTPGEEGLPCLPACMQFYEFHSWKYMHTLPYLPKYWTNQIPLKSGGKNPNAAYRPRVFFRHHRKSY